MRLTGKPPDRTDAALARLVEQGVLSAEQAERVRDALTRPPEPADQGRWWAEVAGYLGGVLLLAGAGVLLATSWDTMSDLVRGVVLAAITLALLAAGLIIGGGPAGLRRLAGAGGVRRRVVGVLFALAAGTAAGAAGVLWPGHPPLAPAGAGLLVAAGGYALLRTAPGLLATATMSVLLGSAVAQQSRPIAPLAIGAIYLAIAGVWAVLSFTDVAHPLPLGWSAAVIIALFGAQQSAGQSIGWAYGLTFALGAGCLALYFGHPRGHTPVLLVAGVVAVAIAAPEAAWHASRGTLSGAVLLIVAGVILVTASGVGLRLRHDRHHQPS